MMHVSSSFSPLSLSRHSKFLVENLDLAREYVVREERRLMVAEQVKTQQAEQVGRLLMLHSLCETSDVSNV